MSIEEMRSGRCAACGGGEVYEVGQHAQLRRPGGAGIALKALVCEVFVCADCGYMQWHAPLDSEARDWLQRKGRRVQPQPPE